MKTWSWRSSGSLLTIASLLLLVAAAPVLAVDWQEAFASQANTIQSAGKYSGSVLWNVESFSALLMEPSATGEFYFSKNAANQRYIGFRDTEPGLTPNNDRKADDPFYNRAAGALNALIWTEGDFGDVRVSGIVNAKGGADGAKSRQGLFVRWDSGSNFYYFNVDFADGQAELLKSSVFYTETVLLRRDIANFEPSKSYRIEFEVIGDMLRGKVIDGADVVADTGPFPDPEPHLYGRSGALLYSSLKAPYEPLEGSFADIKSVSLGGVSAAQVALNKKAWFASKAELRKLDGSIEGYQKLLEKYPNSIDALRGLAWQRATSKKKDKIEPVEAVSLASKAAELHFKTLTDNLQTSGGPSKLDLARTGFVLAGALSSAGQFEANLPANSIILPSADKVSIIIAAEAALSAVLAAVSWVQWGVEIVNAQHALNPTPESAELVAFGQQASELIEARQPLTGLTIPGMQ